MKKQLITLLLAVSMLSAFAGGFQLYSESATDVLSIGGSGVARSGHASNAWYNPAATMDIDRPVISGGTSLIRLDTVYRSQAGSDHMADTLRMTGFFYGVMPITDDVNFTLSINAPYGMVTQWDRDSQLSSLATFSNVRICYISPGIAFNITEDLSLAVGINYAYATAHLAKYTDLSEYASIADRFNQMGFDTYAPSSNKIDMKADGDGIGGFVALHYRPFEDWSFGAKYQSRVKIRVNGEADYRNRGTFKVTPNVPNLVEENFMYFNKGDIRATVSAPAYLALGVENTSIKNLRLMFDAVWTQWSSYRALDISFEKMPGNKPQGGIAKNRRDWHDVWSYRFGAEYQLTDNWVLRGGYMFDVSPSNSRYTSPEMPDSDKHLLSLGVGYHTERWGIDLAYAYVFFDDGDLGTKTAADHAIAKANQGTFSTNCQIFSAQFTLRF